MNVELVLNEISCAPAPTLRDAQARLSQLIQVVRTGVKHGCFRSLRSSIDINSLVLFPDYPISRWRNDEDVDLETRRYFRLITSKYPIDADSPGLADKLQIMDFKLCADACTGLGVALMLDGLAVSLSGNAAWECTTVQIQQYWLDGDDLLEEAVVVNHASQASHVEEHAIWLSERNKPKVKSGTELLKLAPALFPRIRFCGGAENQIAALAAGNPYLAQLLKKIEGFAIVAATWEQGAFPLKDLPFLTSPETKVTLEKYSRERTFLCPDGEKRVFDLHARLTPGAWRLHFYPDPNSRTVWIAYVGPKLSTSSYVM
jgi:hypothetical protein